MIDTACSTAADALLTEQEASALLAIKPETLSVWRATRRYALAYIRVGRCIRYRRSDLEAFIASRTVGAVQAV